MRPKLCSGHRWWLSTKCQAGPLCDIEWWRCMHGQFVNEVTATLLSSTRALITVLGSEVLGENKLPPQMRKISCWRHLLLPLEDPNCECSGGQHQRLWQFSGRRTAHGSQRDGSWGCLCSTLNTLIPPQRHHQLASHTHMRILCPLHTENLALSTASLIWKTK